MMEAAGVTEELKARDPMRWVGLMNTLKAQVEEVLLQELVCVDRVVSCNYIYRELKERLPEVF